MKTAVKIFLCLICIVYLINPGFGVFEFLPDNLPFVGNLDEGAAASFLVLLVQSLRKGRNIDKTRPGNYPERR